MMNDSILTLIDTLLKWLAIAAGIIGAGTIFSHRVNKNFDKRFEAEKEERAEAKKEADEREAARMQTIINLQEGFVAVGHVAQKTAEAHLAQCGENHGISEALDVYCAVRARSDAQMRRDAAKFSHREARGAQ